MQSKQDEPVSATPLARLLGQLPDVPHTSDQPGLWRRLDLEGIARRVIQASRLAAAEQTLQRAQEAIRQRDELAARPATA